MSQQPEAQTQSIQPKKVSRRKLINKVRHKIHRQQKRLLQTYQSITTQKKSALHQMLQPEPTDQNQYNMLNHISLGQNRKMKKKMKKLQKKFGDDQDKIFKNLQKYKQSFNKQIEKTIFNPVNEMQVRRDKRMKRMEVNQRKSKTQVYHKNKVRKVRNTNYKVVSNPSTKSININHGGRRMQK